MPPPNSTTVASNIKPEAWRRLMSLINGCQSMLQLKPVHALFITHGLSSNAFAMSKLLSFTALSHGGDFSYASRLFHHFHSPNSFFYNTLIRAYSHASPHLSLHYFNLMVHDTNVLPNQHTFPFVLTACCNGFWVSEGEKVHNWVFKFGLTLDVYVRIALLRFYCGCGLLPDAHQVFDEIPQRERGVVEWNVIMNGYVKCGLASDCLSLFKEMLGSDVEPDEFCVTTAINACAKLGMLRQGKWLHEYVEKKGNMVFDGVVMTALVDMYAKCGAIDMAMEIFEKMPERNGQCWAALIGGFAVNGYQTEAILCLDRMQELDGLMPDAVALLGVLSACTHAGSVREGLFLLENMEGKYGVAPRHEHYSCVVDMLCKAGKLNEALEIITRMPMQPLASVWGALLSGCRTHKNVELAELAVKELELLEEGKVEEGIYVELSNVYLAYKKCEDASRVRKMIGDRGMKKTPGCSVIEVNGKINEFVAGDVAHPYLSQLHETLNLMSFDLFLHSVETLSLEERD